MTSGRDWEHGVTCFRGAWYEVETTTATEAVPEGRVRLEPESARRGDAESRATEILGRVRRYMVGLPITAPVLRTGWLGRVEPGDLPECLEGLSWHTGASEAAVLELLLAAEGSSGGEDVEPWEAEVRARLEELERDGSA